MLEKSWLISTEKIRSWSSNVSLLGLIWKPKYIIGKVLYILTILLYYLIIIAIEVPFNNNVTNNGYHISVV